jgi:hypothetical protein
VLKVKEILNNYPKVKQMARKMVSVVPLSKRLGTDFGNGIRSLRSLNNGLWTNLAIPG